MLIPWSAFWDRNYFAGAIPALQDLITNNFVRGAVSGLGVVNLFAALSELADMFTTRQGNPPLPHDDEPSRFPHS